MKTSALAASAFALVASTNALGINCRGSGLCPSSGVPGNILNLQVIVDNIRPRNRRYATGQQIACTGQVCAYFQSGATGTAADASRLIGALRSHGCRKCGSCPTKPGNNVNDGQLTVNVVGNPKCQGAC